MLEAKKNKSKVCGRMNMALHRNILSFKSTLELSIHAIFHFGKHTLQALLHFIRRASLVKFLEEHLDIIVKRAHPLPRMLLPSRIHLAPLANGRPRV